MPAAGEQHLPEAQEIGVFAGQVPVKPADLVILTISIIVALLAAAHLISHNQHGDSLGNQQERRKVFDLAMPQVLHPAIIGFSLDPTVPAQVIINAILIVFTVGLVVFAVIGD